MRFRVPIFKLAVNVSNCAIFHFPLAAVCVWQAAVDQDTQDRMWACLGLRHPNVAMNISTIVIGCMLMRVMVDAAIGFWACVEVGNHYTDVRPFTLTTRATTFLTELNNYVNNS